MMPEVMETLHAARAAERDQAMFYRALASAAEDIGDTALSERLNGLHADEQHHVSRLSARLLELEQDLPELRPPSLPEVGLEQWEALAHERELIEVERYEALLTHDLDERTRAMVAEFLDAERHHAEALGGKWMGAN
jgi:rubrerythrin